MATAVQEAAARGRIDFTRGRDWFDPTEHEHAKVQVFGAGGIGSWVALGLAKLGVPYVDVVDFDFIEAHNLPNQMFPLGVNDGHLKSLTLVAQMEQYGAGEYKAYPYMVTADGLERTADHDGRELRLTGPVVVSGFDNMEARKNLWNLVKLSPTVERYIDGRLAGEIIVIYSVDMRDMAARKAYEATLFDDAEGLEAPCTRQSIIDVGMAVGSWITRAVRRHFAGETEPDDAQLFVDHANAKVYKSEWV